MSKTLYVSNIGGKKMAYGFCGTAIEAAHSLDLEIFIVANRSKSTRDDIIADEEKYNVKLLHSDISRSPFAFRQNYKAYKQLVKIIREYEIDYIHCNTPVGGLLGRLVGKKCKVKKVIYQAHGFHFYKGAPLLNWLLYYPVEKWLARYTDALITINQEDYDLAKRKMKLKNGGKVYYVPGVGIDTSQYKGVADLRKNKRAELGLKADDVALISMGDLIERKNYATAIRAVSETRNDRLHYFICGVGTEESALKSLAEQLNVAQQIHFLGFRSDIKELLVASDIFLFTTKQEGLPRSMMEAMASGLPCVASKIRGNTDLLKNGEGGFICDPHDTAEFAGKINLLAANAELVEEMGRTNLMTIQKFSTETVIKEMKNIYAAELLTPLKNCEMR